MAVTKFRMKPVVVTAEQWFSDKEVEGVTDLVPDLGLVANPVVYTPNGPVRIEPGEWIITDVAGERYPCRPEIFETMYEPADVPPSHDASKEELLEWIRVMTDKSGLKEGDEIAIISRSLLEEQSAKLSKAELALKDVQGVLHKWFRC